MRLPRFDRRRLIVPAALLALTLVSIVIYRWGGSTDEPTTLEVKQHSKLNGTGELLAWNPMGTILVTYSDDMTDQYHSAILWDPKSGTRRLRSRTLDRPTAYMEPRRKDDRHGLAGQGGNLVGIGNGQEAANTGRSQSEDL